MHVIFRLQEKKSTRHSIKNFLSIFTHRKRKRRFNNFAHLFEVSPKDILHTSIVYKDAATNTLSYLVAACLITSKIEEGRSLSLISSPESRVCVQHALIFFYQLQLKIYHMSRHAVRWLSAFFFLSLSISMGEIMETLEG